MVTGLAGFVGAKGTIGVVEGTVTGVEAGLVGETVTGLVEGTVMMVGVSGGVITGEGGVGFVGKTVVGVLVVSCRVLLMWTLLGFSLRDKGHISSPSSLLSSKKSLSVYTCAINATILFVK